MKTKTTTKQKLSDSTSMMVVAESIKKQASPIIKKIEDMQIRSQQAYDMAAKAISQLKALSKEAESKEKELTEPAKSIIKSAQELFKPFRTRVQELEGAIKIQMLEFLNLQVRASLKLEEQFNTGKIKKLSTVVSKQNELMNTSSEHAQQRKVWTLNIVDEAVIPRKFMVPDDVAIKAAFKAGQKVAGCTWTQEKTIAI